jgi:hypothetical protein
MKGIAKNSQEYVDAMGLKRWFGLDLEFDQDVKSPEEALVEVESKVRNAIAKSNGQVILDNSIPPGPPTELPVINKAEERLGILIENAATKEELMAYKDNLTTPYLADLFSSKHQQLLIKK